MIEEDERHRDAVTEGRGKVTYSEERWRRDGVGETVEHKRYNGAMGPPVRSAKGSVTYFNE